MDCMDTKEFGRRFYSCPKFQVREHKSFVRCVLDEINYFDLHLVFFFLLQGRGCDYFLWYDLEMCVRAKSVINELKGESKMLKKEINKM